MKILQCLAIFFMLFSSVSNAQVTEYSFKETYEVSLPAQLMISSSDGDIDVVSSQGNQIEVFYVARRNNKVLEISRAALEKDLILEVVHDKNSLRIVVKHRDEERSVLSRDRIDVAFRINAPAQVVSNLNTSDGNISLAGLNGDQECKTSDGDITIASVSGNITARTSDGDVTMKAVNGSLDIKTSDGNIGLSNIIGDVQASTSDGDIVISEVNGNTSSRTSDGSITFRELSGSFTGITSDGNIRGNVLQLKEQLTVRTGDGDIDVTLPYQLGLDLDISGESLHVPLMNFSGTSGEKIIRGKANGGGIPVKLSASDGRVTLAYK